MLTRLIELRQQRFRVQHQRYADRTSATNDQLIISRIDMLIGDWHVDEFGNATREIQARD